MKIRKGSWVNDKDGRLGKVRQVSRLPRQTLPTVARVKWEGEVSLRGAPYRRTVEKISELKVASGKP